MIAMGSTSVLIGGLRAARIGDPSVHRGVIVDATASELVNEATHAAYEEDHPASKTKLTIDEEMTTNVNQLKFCEEQRKEGFRDADLDLRLKAQKKKATCKRAQPVSRRARTSLK